MTLSRPVRLLRITTVPISLKLLLTGQLPHFQKRGFEVLAVSADGKEVADLKAEGIPHRIVPMTRKITPFADLVSLFRLIRVIRAFKPDMVHSHTPKAGLLGMLAAWICRVPVRLHTVAGLPVMERTGPVRKVLLFVEWLTYACATRVYPNSTGLQQFMKENIAINPAKYFIIGRGSSNGIDTTFFSPTAELKQQAAALRAGWKVRPDELVFCFVGRIVSDKGINELVSAFVRLEAEVPCRLVLVGPREDDLDPISDRTKEILASHAGIISLGYLSDVRQPLLASDVFVFPSYREGFPNVVMQACCLEIPCIVSDINGCNEIIQHGETGIIVPPKRTDEVYEAMKTLASNAALRGEFARKGRAYVGANFSRTYLWEQIEQEYSKQLNRV